MHCGRKLKHDQFVLSVSYGDSNGDLGGTSKVIMAHQKMFESAGISHLHIYPRFIRMPGTSVFLLRHWGVTKDGRTQSVGYTDREIIQVIGREIEQGSQLVEAHVHHLLNTDVDQLGIILDAFPVPIKFYLHDYYTMCTQFNLLKNDRQYCGEGKIDSKKCSNCIHYEKSQHHFKKVQAFLERFEDRLQFIAPSDIVKKIWTSAYPAYQDQVCVVSHQVLIGQYAGNCEILSEKSPIRVAFVGGQSANKGWHQWEQATAKANGKGANEVFYHFGKTGDGIPYIKKVPVSFSLENLNAMLTALRLHGIDVAILWSICPETYSYTYFECTAANVFVITNKDSGNIAAMVRLRANGIVLDDEDELAALLCDDAKLKILINAFKSSQPGGPAELIDNTELIKMLPKDGNCISNNIPIYSGAPFSLVRRQTRTILYGLYGMSKRIWRRCAG